MPTDKNSLHSLATGTSVLISGVWQLAPPGKEQAYELKADEVKIIGSTDAEVSATIFPLDMDERLWNPASCYKKPTLTSTIDLSHSEETAYARIPPHNPTSKITNTT